jgi:hypothetical protein
MSNYRAEDSHPRTPRAPHGLYRETPRPEGLSYPYIYDLREEEETQPLESHSQSRPPKNKRPDMRIVDEVCEKLTADPDVDATEIEVDVQVGIVTLSGSVPSRQMKKLAERCLDTIRGVLDIQNNLRVHGLSAINSGDNENPSISS